MARGSRSALFFSRDHSSTTYHGRPSHCSQHQFQFPSQHSLPLPYTLKYTLRTIFGRAEQAYSPVILIMHTTEAPSSRFACGFPSPTDHSEARGPCSDAYQFTTFTSSNMRSSRSVPIGFGFHIWPTQPGPPQLQCCVCESLLSPLCPVALTPVALPLPILTSIQHANFPDFILGLDISHWPNMS
ncbi:hypothetical protein BDZ91DRAFT_177961 [Kalaharituber pfeilii]|nr:hypothetical protein BDZ91DRAFT_177961 [Kalaharituber pfeilii]